MPKLSCVFTGPHLLQYSSTCKNDSSNCSTHQKQGKHNCPVIGSTNPWQIQPWWFHRQTTRPVQESHPHGPNLEKLHLKIEWFHGHLSNALSSCQHQFAITLLVVLPLSRNQNFPKKWEWCNLLALKEQKLPQLFHLPTTILVKLSNLLLFWLPHVAIFRSIDYYRYTIAPSRFPSSFKDWGFSK